MPCRFRTGNRGFTLLELIVVMVLLALTVSLAAPKISGFLFSDPLKASARQLVGLIHQASQLAQRRQLPCLLRYAPVERQFVATMEPRREAERQPGEKPLHTSLAASVSVRDLWTWQGGTRPAEEFVLRFTRDGYVEPSVVHFRDEGGRELSVILSPFLGKVRIEEGYLVPDKDTFRQ